MNRSLLCIWVRNYVDFVHRKIKTVKNSHIALIGADKSKKLPSNCHMLL